MDHDHVKALQLEIDILKARLLPEDTGHIRTAIGVLEARIREILCIREDCKND